MPPESNLAQYPTQGADTLPIYTEEIPSELVILNETDLLEHLQSKDPFDYSPTQRIAILRHAHNAGIYREARDIFFTTSTVQSITDLIKPPQNPDAIENLVPINRSPAQQKRIDQRLNKAKHNHTPKEHGQKTSLYRQTLQRYKALLEKDLIEPPAKIFVPKEGTKLSAELSETSSLTPAHKELQIQLIRFCREHSIMPSNGKMGYMSLSPQQRHTLRDFVLAWKGSNTFLEDVICTSIVIEGKPCKVYMNPSLWSDDPVAFLTFELVEPSEQ